MPALSFFLSPLGKAAMVVLALTAWTIYQRDQAADRARQECQAVQLTKTLDEVTRQRDAARAALDAAEKQQTTTDREMRDLESERDDILAKLKAQGVASCRIPDDVRKRLRNIR